MKNIRPQHGIYKNLPAGAVYNSQAACMTFVLGMAFKASAAPGVIAETMGSSTFWAYLALSVVELIVTVLVFSFVRLRGDDFLRCINSKFYKLCCAVASIWLAFKGTFYFCYCMSYLTRELFGGVAPNLLYLLFLSPIVYIGIKGVRSISRTCEIFAPIIFVLILFNLVCIETDLDFGRNLPVFALPPSEFFATIPKYGLWLGDAIPLMFLRIKNKRLPYVSGGITLTFSLLLVIVLIGVATYGESLKTVSDLLIHLAGFNQLTLEIGRMEWTNMLCVLALAILSLSLLYYGCIAAQDRATGTTAAAKLLYPLAIAITVLSVSSIQTIAEFAVEKLGYVMFALAVGLPFAVLACLIATRTRYRHIYDRLDCVYAPYPTPLPEEPNSLADNILSGYKQEAAKTEIVKENGYLESQQEANN